MSWPQPLLLELDLPAKTADRGGFRVLPGSSGFFRGCHASSRSVRHVGLRACFALFAPGAGRSIAPAVRDRQQCHPQRTLACMRTIVDGTRSLLRPRGVPPCGPLYETAPGPFREIARYLPGVRGAGVPTSHPPTRATSPATGKGIGGPFLAPRCWKERLPGCGPAGYIGRVIPAAARRARKAARRDVMNAAADARGLRVSIVNGVDCGD